MRCRKVSLLDIGSTASHIEAVASVTSAVVSGGADGPMYRAVEYLANSFLCVPVFLASAGYLGDSSEET